MSSKMAFRIQKINKMKHIVSSPSRTEQVYEQLKHSIADCSLAPGSHLIQEELANIFAVSRQPIQQALVLLKNDGLVVEHGARGLYVTPLDKDETIDRYDIRLLLDRFSIMQVCTKVKADTNFKDVVRRSLSKILDEGKDALNSSNVSDAVEHDIAFHKMLLNGWSVFLKLVIVIRRKSPQNKRLSVLTQLRHARLLLV